MQNNGVAQRPPKAVLTIVFDADGQILCQMQGDLNRPIINMLMETAKQDMLAQFSQMEKKAQSGIALPPPGLQVPRNHQ